MSPIQVSPLSPSIPSSFAQKKSTILAHLSLPDGEYTDKSPKGSVDEGIRDLINELNASEGLVTTSSCAGRISVFFEGKGTHGDGFPTSDGVVAATADDPRSKDARGAAPGGKGGGEFLFTSHEPLNLDDLAESRGGEVRASDDRPGPLLHQLFKIHARPPPPTLPSKTRGESFGGSNQGFGPSILHVMAASLKHAQPLLSAAINAGFRESGVQSLRNLDDRDACPMVAIRTAGLALESIIASTSTTAEDRDSLVADGKPDQGEGVTSLVHESYLRMLVTLANERFRENAKRIQRLREGLRDAMRKEEKAGKWENKDARRRRMREVGLERRAEKQKERAARKWPTHRQQQLEKETEDGADANDELLLNDTDADASTENLSSSLIQLDFKYKNGDDDTAH